MTNRMSKKGQVAIFVIIALVIVGGIVLVYTFRDRIFGPSVPAELKPVFDYYQQCIEGQTRAAIDLAESQGGRIYPGIYIPGSEYAPSSSQLNFLGFPVPYWFYVSGNGLAKENVPTKTEMQDEISRYVEENVNTNCNLDSFYGQGLSINTSSPKAKTTIADSAVDISVDMDMRVSNGEVSARKTSHSASIKSSFGKLYTAAKNIYSKEKSDAFLENYTVDFMRLYAPVDGVEISCSGKIWKTREVVEGLKSALEANIAAIKFKGNYYTMTNEENNYFVVDLQTEQQVNMLYSRTWPTKVEIAGAEQELMLAEPVGTQQGMGVMGFCYAPYHFVYDINYPVLVQILDGQEVFQFPVVVIIDKNMPRQGLASEIAAEEPEIDVCQFNTQDVEISVFDTQLNKVDANLSYTCFNQKCELGSTTSGVFSGKAPACFNGYLKASADGYAENRRLFSTNTEKAIDLIVDKEYEVKLNLEVGGKPLDGTAIVTFEGERSISTALPDVSTIKLSEGLYNVSIYVYGNSSLTIPGSTKKQCHEVSSGGIVGGLFGITREECIDITIPETKIDSALIGGGRSEIYVLPSDLKKGELTLKVDSLPMPSSLEALQNNFEAFDEMGVELAI